MADWKIAFVIPAFREFAYLNRSIKALEVSLVQPGIDPTRYAVVVVVNQPRQSLPDTTKDSNRLLLQLESQRDSFPVSLHVLDHTFPGLTDGVGEARKIGMDYAAAQILESPEDRIVSLDADAYVAPNYVETLGAKPLHGGAFTLRFEHLLNEAEYPTGIILYELFLRYMRLGLLQAKSPYAFYTIGSCFGVDRAHYKLVDGMVLKTATEDFHFLNKVRKHSKIEHWTETFVHLSPRLSNRVSLGTGAFMSSYHENAAGAFAALQIPPPTAFGRLAETLGALETFYRNPDEVRKLLTSNDKIEQYFVTGRIFDRLEQLANGSSKEESFQKRLPQLFDGLATWRFLRLFADKQNPPTTMTFIEWINRFQPTDSDSPREVLLSLRKIEAQ